METNIFDFSLFYLTTAVLFGIGAISLAMKGRVAHIIELLEEKSNGRTTSH